MVVAIQSPKPGLRIIVWSHDDECRTSNFRRLDQPNRGCPRESSVSNIEFHCLGKYGLVGPEDDAGQTRSMFLVPGQGQFLSTPWTP